MHCAEGAGNVGVKEVYKSRVGILLDTHLKLRSVLLLCERDYKAVFTTGACTRETTRLCVFCWLLGSMRTETRRNGTSNMLEFSARIRRVPAYRPVTLTGGVNKLVLEGVASARTRIAVFL